MTDDTPAASDGLTTGLTWVEAGARLARDGPNEMPRLRPPSPWRGWFAQMTHFFARLLWVAGALALVAGLPPLGIAIFVVILINGTFAFVQEWRAERAAERLADLLPHRATVVRDGIVVEIDARDVVVDDVVILAAGDRVTADLVCLDAAGLRLDTSMLTGESVTVPVGATERMWAGTFVVEGEGRALVDRIGASTELASITALTRAIRRPTSPLARELHRVVRLITVIAAAVGGVCFAAAIALGLGVRDGFLIAIGVMVALVPEGLLPTVTLSLGVGAQRMAARHALVRHLEAVETLGSTTFVCTDKTGTLTMNEMSVVEAWTPTGSLSVSGDGYAPTATVNAAPDVAAMATVLAHAAERCSTGRAELEDGRWRPRGDPMEAAIWVFARRLGAKENTTAPQQRFPFDPIRRRMSVLDGTQALVKGAPDAVLPLCRNPSGASDALGELASRGLRVLAVARRTCDQPTALADVVDLERDLELLGLLAFEDPPRPSARAALHECRRAGIKVAMITGDHPDTAAAIARETELASGEVRVLLGAELPDDLDELGRLVDTDGIVIARVDPEHKVKVALALQRRGHVVAMTGDGVNDAPALHQADIGIAMGRSGTDVARAAADLVLLDDEFATIVAAVRQGRSTFANIRRFLTYHLTDNVAELTPFVVWALSGGRFPLAIGVMQVLMLDIGTDLLPALALGAEPPSDGDDIGLARERHLIDRALITRVFARLGPAEAFVELLAFVGTFVALGWRPGSSFPTGADLAAASGAAFGAVVIAQCANAFACRSEVHPVWSRRPRNRLLITAVLVELVVLAITWYWRPLADLLDQTPPTSWGFLLALGAVPTLVGVDAVDKWRRRASGARRPASPDDQRGAGAGSGGDNIEAGYVGI